MESLTMSERLEMKKCGNSEKHDGGNRNTTRLNKNCPSEVTSKRPVPRFRQVVDVRKTTSRDPRFDSVSGKFNEDLFQKSYSFLKEYKETEYTDLKNQLKKTKSKTKREGIKEELKSLQNEEKAENRIDRLKEAKSKQRKQEREAVAGGKNPFYQKRSAKKMLELQTRYEELQEKGGLSKYMAKKRKQNASKDHRWLPTGRKA